MIFNSFEYLIFLPLVAALYFIIASKFRWILLLSASYYFYMSWRAEYALLILFCTVINYFGAILIAKEKSKTKKKVILTVDLILSFGVLFVYKYLGFLTENINSALDLFNSSINLPDFEILLPVGISFFTFQTLSYTIDVYRGNTKVERHFGIFALFISFFPQLVAGPIERSDNLLPQFHDEKRFDISRITAGLRIILWGLFKKVVIADRLAVLVNTVYNSASEHSGAAFIIATLAFALQIYGDFSGYSDIAIGSAKIMGFDLMQNFKRPYFSKTTAEFWRRWHISLSSWFRDYVYIPLGGSRCSKARYFVNNMITFALSGLWHGAEWTFVIWGIINGVYTSVSHGTKALRARISSRVFGEKGARLHKILQVGITFALICFSWIFFRANSMYDAIYIITHIFPLNFGEALELFGKYQLVSCTLLSVLFAAISYFSRGDTCLARVFYRHRSVRYVCYLTLFALIMMFGVTGNETAFIYFQF